MIYITLNNIYKVDLILKLKYKDREQCIMCFIVFIENFKESQMQWGEKKYNSPLSSFYASWWRVNHLHKHNDRQLSEITAWVFLEGPTGVVFREQDN